MIFLLLATALADPVWVRDVVVRDQTFTVVSVDVREASLELVGGRSPVRDFADLRSSGPYVAATNAGIFAPNYRAVGLHIEAGEEFSPLERSDGAGNFYLKPNGVFWIDADGPHVAATPDYAPAGVVSLATQSGPLLLDDGVRHPAFRDASPNRLLRSGVGVDGHTVHIAISRGFVRFAELAALFAELGCEDALYLDGTISALDLGSDSPPQGRFAGFLVVRER
jgi:uncharacterized protein YigE (DUF2233 family)